MGCPTAGQVLRRGKRRYVEVDGVITVRCCQEWDVPAGGGWGMCGLCGQRPVPTLGDVDPKLVTLTY